jgi:hypothetical protein
MIVCVCLVIALLILTKLCDVVSTLQRLEDPHAETNPIALGTILRFGTTKAVWIVFVLALSIIGLAGWAAINGDNITRALFIVAGVAISIVQGAVAHCNWKERDNFITRRARILHSYMSKIIPR